MRWGTRGGDPDLVFEVGLWAVVAGLVGGRMYFDITTPDQMGHQWYAPVAIWQGGLGIWGAVLFGALAGAIVVRRHGASVAGFLDTVAPAILVGQAIGRLGNYLTGPVADMFAASQLVGRQCRSRHRARRRSLPHDVCGRASIAPAAPS